MWPFNRTEKRNAEGYTTAILNRLLAYASPDGKADVGATSAVAIASGLVSRAFASATVEPGPARTGLDPSRLAEIGAAFVLAGESVWLIDVDAGVVRLLRASSWDVAGSTPDDWRYHLTIPGPTDTVERHVPAEAVLHPRVNCPAHEPHRGRASIALAGMSATVLANAERQLAEEMGGPVGRLIPAPLDEIGDADPDPDEPDPLAELEATLAALKGRSALVPSMARDWGGGPAGARSTGDWRSERIGADPPASVVELRQAGHDALLAAAGVPPVLFACGGTSTASREALRFFLHATVSPLARVLQVEAASKLGVPVELDFTSLHASDVQGRARAFQSMVAGGMDVDRAAMLSGMLSPEDTQ